MIRLVRYALTEPRDFAYWAPRRLLCLAGFHGPVCDGRAPKGRHRHRPPMGASWVVHNLVAHPLLVLVPPVGEWLHDRTDPDPSSRDPRSGT